MTVEQLVEILKKMPQDAGVRVSVCDPVIGLVRHAADGVRVDEDGCVEIQWTF